MKQGTFNSQSDIDDGAARKRLRYLDSPGAVSDKLSVNTRAVDATYAIDRQRVANALLACAAFPTSLRSV